MSRRRLGNISITRTLVYLAGQICWFGNGRTGIAKGIMMLKAAFVILASGDSPESLGRVVNALMGAYEMMESGQEVKIIFDGAGTQAAAALSAPDHKYHDLFRLVKGKVSGICSYCANAYGVAPKIEQANLPFAADFKGHPSLKELLEEQYQILTF
jgi:hypothetical protein